MMVLSATTSLLAAGSPDWIQIVIVVGIVLFSLLGSAAKWIAQQLADARERAAAQRSRPMVEPIPQQSDREISDVPRGIPPVVHRRSGRPVSEIPPVFEKVFEVLLERSAGTPLERRVRELMPTPPLPPSKRRIETAPKKPVRPPPPAPKRPMTIAEREELRNRVKQTEAEREAQRLAQREQQFTDQTNQRIGHVETHIAALDGHEAQLDEFRESLTLDDPDAVRRALVLAEILGPPLALRTPA